ncbi:hypothetical protein WICPIJ_006053 [Wickerhamomyces pijperi]|uniref:Uncharacterized protein n=1 Tax=Wickerhamomyces pijperi TaxID=599730 RepID=A0A9P8TL82_WICPI|nr:hypothetical protein WICPIJ_006053 [Wickerhamomyces pijperi]
MARRQSNKADSVSSKCTLTEAVGILKELQTSLEPRNRSSLPHARLSHTQLERLKVFINHTTAADVQKDMMFLVNFNSLCSSIHSTADVVTFEIILTIGIKLLCGVQDDFWFTLMKLETLVGPFPSNHRLIMLSTALKKEDIHCWKVARVILRLIQIKPETKEVFLQNLESSSLVLKFQLMKSNLVACFYIMELLELLGYHNGIRDILSLSIAFRGKQSVKKMTPRQLVSAKEKLLNAEILNNPTVFELDEFNIEKIESHSRDCLRFIQVSKHYITLVTLLDSSTVTFQFNITSVRNLQKDKVVLRFHLIQPPKSSNLIPATFPDLSIVTLRFANIDTCSKFNDLLGVKANMITMSTPRKISEPIEAIGLDEENTETSDQLKNNQNSNFSVRNDETATTSTTSKNAVKKNAVVKPKSKNKKLPTENDKEEYDIQGSPEFVPIGDTQDSSQSEIPNNITGFRDKGHVAAKSRLGTEMITSSLPFGNDNDIAESENGPALEKLSATRKTGATEVDENDMWDFLSIDASEPNKVSKPVAQKAPIALDRDSTPRISLERSKIQVTQTIKKLNIQSSSGNLYDQIYDQEGQTSPLITAQSRATTRVNQKRMETVDTYHDSEEEFQIQSDASYKPSFDPVQSRRTRPKRKLRSVVTDIDVDELVKETTRPLKKVKITSVKDRVNKDANLNTGGYVHKKPASRRSIDKDPMEAPKASSTESLKSADDITDEDADEEPEEEVAQGIASPTAPVSNMATSLTDQFKISATNIQARITAPALPTNSILSEAYTNQLQNQIFESITNFSNDLISKIKVINAEINKKIVNDLTNKYEYLFKELNVNFNNDVKEMVELIDDVKDLLHLDEDQIRKYIQAKKFMSQTQGSSASQI